MASVADPKLAEVTAALRAADPDGARLARTLRRTHDQIYDGGNTGRFRWEELTNIEKAHFGSLVEINLSREFSFGDGIHLDYRIAAVDVDGKGLPIHGKSADRHSLRTT